MIKLPLSFKYIINRLEKLQRHYQDALKNSENSINSLTNAKEIYNLAKRGFDLADNSYQRFICKYYWCLKIYEFMYGKNIPLTLSLIERCDEINQRQSLQCKLLSLNNQRINANVKGLIQSCDKEYKGCINETFNLACQICITIVVYILYCSDFQDIEFKYRECKQNLAIAEYEYKAAIQKLNHDKEEVAKLYKAVQNQKTYIAKKVGVPACYIENVCIFRRELENKVDIYFGGKNNPAGYGHGHYIVRLSDGRVLYRSSPTTSINQ